VDDLETVVPVLLLLAVLLLVVLYEEVVLLDVLYAGDEEVETALRVPLLLLTVRPEAVLYVL
jgi:hypothetical protein